jgi:hypothetical protein
VLSLLTLSKILIVVSVVGLLRCSPKFRQMSRELDDQALGVLKRGMRAAEDCGYPGHLVPLLIALTALCFMLSAYVTTAAVR